jgi:hypothetical protein
VAQSVGLNIGIRGTEALVQFFPTVRAYLVEESMRRTS